MPPQLNFPQNPALHNNGPQHHKKTGLTPHGFTLLEIMVSISIIAIVLVSLFQMHAATIVLAEKVKFNAVATALAQKKITEISMDMEDTGNTGGDFGDEFPGYSWECRMGEMSVFDENIISEKQAEHMKRIELSIFLGDRHVFTLQTWVYVNSDA
ncbi:general secretion pathway protein I [Desulfocicer vacuolatum DSM 3385]|uniref:General secretion pathway protein I n=1 Tax=Desulfocicer vacuolatum DSM 3385 TaxID=1121400 RepID=A0A1W1ZFG2_9BACT|nr:type II secretion system protein [Desulfocicer vacuolatum]SMC47229.1 general secretion pathway protein I [Desulfocicer vacuolatum DSM 3385]